MIRTGSKARAGFEHCLRITLVTALVVVIVPVGPPAGHAQVTTADTYWVSPCGNDANPGTDAQPFRTITHAASLTTIQGDSNSALLLFAGWGDGDALEGFTIRDGGVAGGFAAVHVDVTTTTSAATAPEVRDCAFFYNVGSQGAGLHVGSGIGTNLVVSDCTFTNNAGTCGGGIHAEGSGHLTIRSSTFVGNSAVGGGAIHVVNEAPCTVIVEDNEFSWNSTTEAGGAILWEGDSIADNQALRHNDLSSNHAGYYGGAFYLVGGTLTIERNEADSNSAGQEGGFAYPQRGSVLANNNYLVQNAAGSTGGAWLEDL